MISKKLKKKLVLTLGLTTLTNVLPTVIMPLSAYADSGVPVIGKKLLTWMDMGSSIKLTWEKAKDDKTPQNKLRYYLYEAENQNYGSSIGKWETNAKLLNNSGTLDISEWNVTGLKKSSVYTYMLVVEDEDGNKAAYELESPNIKAVSNNVAGNNVENNIVNNNVVSSTVVSNTVVNSNSGSPILGKRTILQSDSDYGEMLSWQKATDDKTPQNQLRYYLYRAENSNYGTNISDWEKSAKLLNSGGTLDLGEWNATGLRDDSTYAFMLVVEDEDGNKTAYERAIRDLIAASNDVGDVQKFASAKAKALEFISTYNFKSNMSWGEFNKALQYELSGYGILYVGDSYASVDKKTGFVSATVFLSKDYGERYIFPFTAQASDIQNTDGDFTWNQNSDGTWNLSKYGKAITGWQQVGGKWYYLNPDRRMQTGWFNAQDGNWYCFKDSGEMASNETINGYYFNSKGVWIG